MVLQVVAACVEVAHVIGDRRAVVIERNAEPGVGEYRIAEHRPADVAGPHVDALAAVERNRIAFARIRAADDAAGARRLKKNAAAMVRDRPATTGVRTD